jgi:hypothetical protein
LYGSLSYVVSLRRREVAVHLALGAMRRDVIRALITTAARVVTVGCSCGLVLALIFTRSLSAMLYGSLRRPTRRRSPASSPWCSPVAAAAGTGARRARRVHAADANPAGRLTRQTTAGACLHEERTNDCSTTVHGRNAHPAGRAAVGARARPASGRPGSIRRRERLPLIFEFFVVNGDKMTGSVFYDLHAKFPDFRKTARFKRAASLTFTLRLQGRESRLHRPASRGKRAHPDVQ